MYSLYLEDLIKAMVVRGFALISYVITDSEQIERRASYDFVHSLFFHVIGKAVIVQLVYHECKGDRRGQGFWTLRLYVDYRPYRECLDLVTPHGPGDIGPVPLIDTAVECRGFGTSGDWGAEGFDTARPQLSYRFETEPAVKLLEPIAIAASLQEWVDVVRPFLASYFDWLQVTDFPPHYSMEGCGWDFWKAFDTGYFIRVVVRRPWGSRYGPDARVARR